MDRVVLLGQRVIRFVRLLVSRFATDQGPANAASLTFATLLSIVPLMTVMLSVFSAFPISGRVAEMIQGFLFENFIPTSGEILQDYLQQFASKASRLTGAGFAFLVVVALLLMANIDRALNTIWRVKVKRRAISKFIVYWAILSLGPLLMGASIVVTSYLVSIPIISGAASTIGFAGGLLKLAPLLASAVAFTLLYAVVPNCSVPIRHALAGGLLAALLFELAKRGFAFYLTSFPAYEAIYGALALIPIFLVWIYLSWLVTLLGAEFACCLGIFREDDLEDDGGRNDLLLAFRLIGRLWQARHAGETLTTQTLAEQMENASEEHVESLLLELQEGHLLLRTEEREWGLARDLSEVPLHELYQIRPFLLPEQGALQRSEESAERMLGDLLLQVEEDLEESLSVSLGSLYMGEAAKQ
jgi:membrane protein